jgi:hypothetical protein
MAIRGLAGVSVAVADGAAAARLFGTLGFVVEDGVIRLANGVIRLVTGERPGLRGLLIDADPPLGESVVTGILCENAAIPTGPAPVHPNGARAIASVTALVADPVGLMGAWEQLIGPASATATDETVAIRTGNGLIFLCRPDDLDQLHPEADEEPVPPPPALVALTLSVGDLTLAAAILKAAGVPYGRDPSGLIRINRPDCGGVFLEFVPSRA